jgi:hypothetical protein
VNVVDTAPAPQQCKHDDVVKNPDEKRIACKSILSNKGAYLRVSSEGERWREADDLPLLEADETLVVQRSFDVFALMKKTLPPGRWTRTPTYKRRPGRQVRTRQPWELMMDGAARSDALCGQQLVLLLAASACAPSWRVWH